MYMSDFELHNLCTLYTRFCEWVDKEFNDFTIGLPFVDCRVNGSSICVYNMQYRSGHLY